MHGGEDVADGDSVGPGRIGGDELPEVLGGEGGALEGCFHAEQWGEERWKNQRERRKEREGAQESFILSKVESVKCAEERAVQARGTRENEFGVDSWRFSSPLERCTGLL